MNLEKTYNPSSEELVRRNDIITLQNAILEMDENLGEDPFPLTHHFAPGIYAREIFIPGGYVIIGKIHKHNHFIIFLDGDVTIVSEKGKEHITKPGIMISPMGIKRAVYANKDSRIITIHPTEETDLDKIEDEVIAKDYSELEKLE